MSDSKESSSRNRRQRGAGPQGTMVMGREEVDRLLAESHQETVAGAQAHLRGIGEAGDGQVFALSREGVLVGRSPDCSIRLEDSSVSAEHARLVRSDGGWRIVNLLSTNGTFVNEQRVSSADLVDGDTIRFGGVEFVLHDPGARGTDEITNGSPWRRRLAWGLLAVFALALLIWLI